MAHFKFIIALLIVTVVFISCNTDNPVSYKRSERDEIVPLAVGNKWKYEINFKNEFLDSNNNFSFSGSETHWAEIIGDTLIKGNLLFKIKTKILNSDNTINESPTELVKNTSLGYSHFTGIKDSFKLEARYPANIGDAMAYESNFKLISKNEEVKTSLGTFICYHFQCQIFDTNGILTNQCDEFYSIGIGLVKMNNYYNSNSVINNYEKILTEVSVK